MPNRRSGQSITFRAAVREVRTDLRKAGGGAIQKLTSGECVLGHGRNEKRFSVGWRVMVDVGGSSWPLKLLLSGRFPYDLPRIALGGDSRFLKWPHVEPDGLLCLPAQDVAPTTPYKMVEVALAAACKLISDCQPEPNQDEFRREFVSYWNQSCEDSSHPLYSLLSPEGGCREIVLWNGNRFDVVGESKEQVIVWLRNFGVVEPTGGFSVHRAIFGKLNVPPVPSEFPRSVGQFRSWINDKALEVSEAFERGIVSQTFSGVVFAAEAGGALGLIAVTLTGKTNLTVNGFRQGKAPEKLLRNSWYSSASMQRRSVERIDAAWVHGRGKNPEQKRLSDATVTIIGCGALGSHIAVRLGQSGVEKFILIDPQLLVSANVGRHALGMRSIGEPKASELDAELRRRFPHIKSILSYSKGWEALGVTEVDQIRNSDLIISAVGEWGVEGAIDQWHRAANGRPPILYAWMEEHAVAAHALAIINGDGCLHCILDENGRVKEPEVEWGETSTLLLAEPACGVAYMPFGPIELGHAEAMVSDTAINILLGKITQNCQVTHTTNTDRLTSLGGMWSESHSRHRPAGYSGIMSYARPISSRADCPACGPHE